MTPPSRRCRLDRTRRAGQAVGPVTELEQKVAANPLDHQGVRPGDRAQCPGQFALKPPTSCSKSSSAIASGTTTVRARAGAVLRSMGRPDEQPSMDASGCRRFFFVGAFRRSGNRSVTRIPTTNKLTPTADADQCRISGPGELPEIIGVRCRRIAAAPARCRSIFSSRAIWRWWMIRWRDGHRLIGMIQPDICTAGTRRGPCCFGLAASAASPSRRVRRRPLHIELTGGSTRSARESDHLKCRPPSVRGCSGRRRLGELGDAADAANPNSTGLVSSRAVRNIRLDHPDQPVAIAQRIIHHAQIARLEI